MDAYIDREYQQLHPAIPSRRTRDMFGRMVVISLALHAISSVILLSPHGNTLQTPSVSFLDLKNVQLPQEVASAPSRENEVARKAETLREDPAPPSAPAPPTTSQLPETEKLQRDVQTSLANAAKNPEALQESSFNLGLTSGYFSSIAEGESLRGDIREYYFRMLREINEKWWLYKGSQQGFRGVLVTIVVARNGVILQKMLVRGSGNPAFDKTIMQTLDAASPLPPLPPSYELEYFSAPLRFKGPLDLFTS